MHVFPAVQVCTALRTAALGLSAPSQSDAPAVLSTVSNRLEVCRKEQKNQQKKPSLLLVLPNSEKWRERQPGHGYLHLGREVAFIW